mmetsp:Transcript_22064/g.50399  ORF Transcript_22064/g.50399 Transcript_22064/m.50399 type:complete len:245 (+) Transcript_22064:255-989(+)
MFDGSLGGGPRDPLGLLPQLPEPSHAPVPPAELRDPNGLLRQLRDPVPGHDDVPQTEPLDEKIDERRMQGRAETAGLQHQPVRDVVRVVLLLVSGGGLLPEPAQPHGHHLIPRDVREAQLVVEHGAGEAASEGSVVEHGSPLPQPPQGQGEARGLCQKGLVRGSRGLEEIDEGSLHRGAEEGEEASPLPFQTGDGGGARDEAGDGGSVEVSFGPHPAVHFGLDEELGKGGEVAADHQRGDVGLG